MLTDIQTQIDHYANLARIVVEDNERLEAILKTLNEIGECMTEMRAGAETLQARHGKLLAGLDSLLPPEERGK